MPWASCPTESPPLTPLEFSAVRPFPASFLRRREPAARCANRASCSGFGVGRATETKIAMHRATISPPQVDNPSLLAETQSDCHSDCPPGAASHPLMQSLIHS